MSWRSVVITQPTKLSIKNRQLQITQDEEWTIPVEDISTIMLETPQVNMSAKLISTIAESQVVMFTCDEKHIPNGIIMPFNCHSRQLKVITSQLGTTESFKKRCWQKIIIQKIQNQANVLKLADKKIMGEHLEYLAQKVRSGDTDNKEAIAARGYFNTLYGKGFCRDFDNIFNSCLNYGYAILRGAIARTIVAYGYIPSIGIHHKSELNNYNLADDFIEVFRPIVDLWVKQNVTNNMEFDKYIRANLVNLLNVDIEIQGKIQSVKNAIEIMISSYTTALNQKDSNKLELPKIIPLHMHRYE